MVSVSLTDKDAAAFKEYLKYKDFIDSILDADAHHQFGKVVMLDVDMGGNIKSVRYETKISWTKDAK